MLIQCFYIASGSPAHLIIQDSPYILKAAEFAKNHLFVTKHKDSEPRSCSAANHMNPGDPSVNFGKFFDGESLLQEDLYENSMADLLPSANHVV